MYICERCARPIKLARSIADANRDGTPSIAEHRDDEKLEYSDMAARLAHIGDPDIRAALAKLADTPVAYQSLGKPNLFNTLSSAPGTPPVNHPLCERCAKSVITDLNERTARLASERDILDTSASAAPEPQPCDLEGIRVSNQRAKHELCSLDDEYSALKYSETQLAAEEAAIAAEEEA